MRTERMSRRAVAADQGRLPQLPAEGLARLAVVLAVVGLSRTTWLEMVKRGEAPRPLRIGPTKTLTAWRVQDIRSWLAAQGAES
jgi:predicted DNA-binding transcriptional regulator AlpA